MGNNRSLTNILLVFVLLVVSIGIFLLIGYWDNAKQARNPVPTIAEMSREIIGLESSILELEALMQDQSVEIGMKDQLLERKKTFSWLS